jgi:hypothetical protein
MPKSKRPKSNTNPTQDQHLKNLEAVSAENARLANETPLTKEQAEDISRRSTQVAATVPRGRSWRCSLLHVFQRSSVADVGATAIESVACPDYRQCP